jgi:hypothetical protein
LPSGDVIFIKKLPVERCSFQCCASCVQEDFDPVEEPLKLRY